MGRLAVPVQLVGLVVGDGWAWSVWGRSGALGFGFVALMFLGWVFGGWDLVREEPPPPHAIVDPDFVQQPSTPGKARRLLRKRRRLSPAGEHMPPRSAEEIESWT